MDEHILNILFKLFIPNGYVYEGFIEFNGTKCYTYNNCRTENDPMRVSSDLIQDLRVISNGHMEKELIDMLTFYIVMENTTFIESGNIKFFTI